MRLTTVEELRRKVMRRWETGDLLRAAVGEQQMFPWKLTCSLPTGPDVADHSAAINAWLCSLRAEPALRVEERTINTRQSSWNTLPVGLWLDRAEDAIAFIHEGAACEAYRELHAYTAAHLAELLPWVYRHPLRALTHRSVWPRLLDVVGWLRCRPRPGVYLREIDLPGIDTKFTETYRAVLAELFDQTLPEQAIDVSFRATTHFEARYGFRVKPERVRLRVLDPVLRFAGLPLRTDVQLDVQSFAALRLEVQRVFITENEINFLAFPAAPGAIVIFGGGYGGEQRLRTATWLRELPIDYWGDIDTHGFAVLHDLRELFPQTRSLMMDRETLFQNRCFWGTEPKKSSRVLKRLTPAEEELWRDLQHDRFATNVRLEQERIPFTHVQAAIAHIAEGTQTRANANMASSSQ